jgi:sugar lactone lactonase YvrE
VTPVGEGRIELEVAAAAGCELGEGPVWSVEEQRLLFVDIKGGVQYSWAASEGVRSRRRFDGLVGFAIPRRAGGLVAGVDHRLELIDPDGTARTIAEVETEFPDNRFNDAKCDPAGRLWAGTMSMSREPGVAALYRLEPGGELEPLVEGLTISNGLGWSPDAGTMYLIDSTTQRIDRFDFDPERGRPSNRRSFVEIDPGDGLPDGLAVDADGGVWVALFGGAEVRRYDAAAALDLRLPLPTSNCTCPAFGGPDLRDLFVTTAKHRLDPAELAEQPLAGALFRARSPQAGLSLNRFAA